MAKEVDQTPLIKELVLGALQNNTPLPLRLLFLVPGLSLAHEYRFNRELYDALRNIRPPASFGSGLYLPLDSVRKSILPTMEQYERLQTDKDTRYPIGRGDRAIALENHDLISKLYSGRTVIELCAGNSEKLKDVLARLTVLPKKIILHDYSLANLETSTRCLARQPNPYPRDQIVKIRGDINDPSIWGDTLSALAKDWNDDKDRNKANSSVVVDYRGATINDFEEDEQVLQLETLGKALPSRTIFLISWDRTQSKTALETAYGYKFKQLCLCAALYGLRASGEPGRKILNVSRVEPKNYVCKVDIDQGPEYSDVVTSIVDIKSGWKVVYDRIRKPTPEKQLEIIKRAGMELVGDPMCYTRDGMDHAVVALMAKQPSLSPT